MTVVNIPRDDLGRQRLEEANNARSSTTAVAPLTAGNGVGPQANPSPVIPVAPPEERRQGERRQGRERRGDAQSTLLDTRSPYERRTHERRAQTDSRPKARSRGLNVFI